MADSMQKFALHGEDLNLMRGTAIADVDRGAVERDADRIFKAFRDYCLRRAECLRLKIEYLGYRAAFLRVVALARMEVRRTWSQTHLSRQIFPDRRDERSRAQSQE